MSEERARYVETLKLERGMIAQRPKSPVNEERLAEIDRVLDTYSDKPAKRQVETADKPPARRTARKSTRG